mgnify:FL=1
MSDFLCFEIIPTDISLRDEVEKKNEYLEFFKIQPFSRKILDFFNHCNNYGFTYLMKSKYL